MERVPIRLGKLRTSVKDSPAAADISVRIQDSGVRDGDGGTALFAASVARVCRICVQNAARYTCPRCNAPYCSVACYKTHGESCTEQFYEEHVRDAMQLNSSTSAKDERAMAKKMSDMLARVKVFQDESNGRGMTGGEDAMRSEQGDDDAELQMQMLERLEKLALMDEDEMSLDDLTPEQRAQFLAEVANGRLSKYIKLWQPWWLLDARTYQRETEAKRQELVIEEINSSSIEDSSSEDEEGPILIESSAFPVRIFTTAMARAIPESLDSMIRGSPSPSLRFHLIEILFSYAFVLRTFNGDWQQDVGEAVLALLHLCTVLSGDAKYDSVEHVLHACLLKRIDTDHGGGRSSESEVSQRIVHDVTLLLGSKVFLLDAVSDAQAMLAAYRTELQASLALTSSSSSSSEKSKSKSEKREEKARRGLVKRLELTDRKLQFFQIWVFHTPETAFQTTAQQLEQAALATATTFP